MAPKRYVSSAANITSSSSCLATTSDTSMKMQRKSMGFPHSPVLVGNFTEELCQLDSFSSAIAHTTCQSGDQIPMENAKPQAKQPRRRSTLSQAFLNSKKRRSIKSEFTGNSSIETRDEQIIKSPPRPPRPAQQRVAQKIVAKSNPDKATIKSNRSRQLQMTRNPSTPPQNNSGAKMQQERPTSEEDRR
ncbi:unnamed protein product [Lampetra fluviatilis]